jgi:hypothetical protein
MTGRWLLSAVAGLALVLVWFVGPYQGAARADDTLTTTNTTITYTHGPFFVPNVTDQLGPPNCSAPSSCDDYTLNVNVPSGTDATNQISITFTYDQSVDSTVDFDVWVYNSAGQVIASNVSGVSPSTVIIPAVSGTYTVRADPWQPGGETYTSTIQLQPKSTPNTAPPPDAATAATGVAPRFADFAVPRSLGGNDAGEPSLGANWTTGRTMYIAGLQTFQVSFDDSTSPGTATWKDVSAFNTSKTSLDPILYTDHTYGRTFVSQLTGQDSLTSYTDNDGAAWTPSQGGGIPSGVDHQSIGDGPYSKNLPVPTAATLTGFKNAVYYCSQDIAASFCARSDNGGLTFGAGVPIYNMTTCGGIHGHVKVAPDGTVYVPNRSCGGKQGVAVSTDNGTTWTVHTIPDSTAAIGNDPSVGIGSDGTIYFGYQGADGHARIAVSHDQGVTWSKSVDVGALAGIQNSVFPSVVAGDANRASFAFLGTTTGGDFQSQSQFNGVWYLYVATTYDGGKTWSLVNATPNDPVQRGSICINGTTCSNTPDDRNLLDFIDTDLDSHGRVEVAYADGCVGACVAGTGTYNPNNTAQSQQSQLNSFTADAHIVRQSGGNTLFAKYDTTQPAVPGRPQLNATETSSNGPVSLTWQAPDNGGSAITDYVLYKGTSSGGEKKLADLGTHTSYQDTKVKAGTTYYYYLVAKNASGTSPASPEVTPQLVNGKPMCTAPGQLVVTDASGDQVGAPTINNSLDITGISIQEPGNTNDLAITLSVSDLTSVLPLQQWRVFWDDPSSPGNRWYVGMDAGATGSPSFIYGTNVGLDSPVKYAPGVQETTNTALPGSGYDPANGTITIVVPKDGVGSPAAGSTLTNVQARTFILTGTGTTMTQTTIDSSPYNDYQVVGNSYCS